MQYTAEGEGKRPEKNEGTKKDNIATKKRRKCVPGTQTREEKKYSSVAHFVFVFCIKRASGLVGHPLARGTTHTTIFGIVLNIVLQPFLQSFWNHFADVFAIVEAILVLISALFLNHLWSFLSFEDQ